MPFTMRKVPKKSCYRVINAKTGKVKARCSTKKNAMKQIRLLRALSYNPIFRKTMRKGGVQGDDTVPMPNSTTVQDPLLDPSDPLLDPSAEGFDYEKFKAFKAYYDDLQKIVMDDFLDSEIFDDEYIKRFGTNLYENIALYKHEGQTQFVILNLGDNIGKKVYWIEQDLKNKQEVLKKGEIKMEKNIPYVEEVNGEVNGINSSRKKTYFHQLDTKSHTLIKTDKYKPFLFSFYLYNLLKYAIDTNKNTSNDDKINYLLNKLDLTIEKYKTIEKHIKTFKYLQNIILIRLYDYRKSDFFDDNDDDNEKTKKQLELVQALKLFKKKLEFSVWDNNNNAKKIIEFSEDDKKMFLEENKNYSEIKEIKEINEYCNENYSNYLKGDILPEYEQKCPHKLPPSPDPNV